MSGCISPIFFTTVRSAQNLLIYDTSRQFTVQLSASYVMFEYIYSTCTVSYAAGPALVGVLGESLISREKSQHLHCGTLTKCECVGMDASFSGEFLYTAQKKTHYTNAQCLHKGVSFKINLYRTSVTVVAPHTEQTASLILSVTKPI